MGINLLPIEISLLTGKWDPLIPLDPHNPTVNLPKLVVDGAFRDVLLSPQAQNVFKPCFSDILATPLDALFDLSVSPTEPAEGELILLTISIACLHAFVQANWTGPDVDVTPLEVLALSPGVTPPQIEELLNRKAISELAYGGEPAYHLAHHAAFLRLAQILLSLQYNNCQSAAWWRLRAKLVHQQILDDPVAIPDDILTSLESLGTTITSDRALSGRLLLEMGLHEHHFTHDKSAADLFVQAARATGLEYELTGALGKRTKFQQTDLSQLVLLAESHLEEGSSSEHRKNSGVSEEMRAIGSEIIPPDKFPETLELHDDTLLEHTAFTTSTPTLQGSRLSHLDPASQPALHPLDQCILLSLCLNVRNTSPSHGLTTEQMTPYVTRVLSHPKNWSVHTMALLLRSRLESSRTRTVERSTLQLQALIDQMPTTDSTVSERLFYFHSIPLPSKWDMERELALRFMSLGVIRSALEIFERLEMWEEVVKCWQAMERPDKAKAIVRDLLEGRKEESDVVISRGKVSSTDRRHFLDAAREAKLWCILGDLEPDNASTHYTRAWSVSNQMSGRAARSLGGYHFVRGDYTKSITWLLHAVSINPMLLRSWFVLGCAYVRQEDWKNARDAFSRCVAIDDEDGESWSNLASVYLRMGTESDAEVEGRMEDLSLDAGEKTAKRVPFASKMLAFRALKQGLKYNYENWRMWSNYMIVAMDVGELAEACRALARVVEETSVNAGAQSVDEDVLERLVDAVTRAPNGANATADSEAGSLIDGDNLLKRVLDLFDYTILPRVSSPRIFRSYARLLMWQLRWDDALKAYLDGYRCCPAGMAEKDMDVEKWRDAVREVEDIVDILRNFGPRVAGYKWRLQGRSVIRTFMGRTKEFEDEKEWKKLMQLQDELRNDD